MPVKFESSIPHWSNVNRLYATKEYAATQNKHRALKEASFLTLQVAPEDCVLAQTKSPSLENRISTLHPFKMPVKNIILSKRILLLNLSGTPRLLLRKETYHKYNFRLANSPFCTTEIDRPLNVDCILEDDF